MPPKQKMLLGLFGMVFSGAGLFLSDKYEKYDMKKRAAEQAAQAGGGGQVIGPEPNVATVELKPER